MDHVALTPEGWPIITRAFFTGRNNYKPDIDEMEVKIGDMILICSDGIYGNGKWNTLQEALTEDCFGLYLLYQEKVAKENPHDNYSAILIKICDDEPESKRDTYLFKLRRRLKDTDDKFEYVEFFRARTEAHFRFMEVKCCGDDDNSYDYGASCFPDGNGAKWKINENKQ